MLIEVADMMQPPIRNRATDEGQKAVKKGLGGAFKRS